MLIPPPFEHQRLTTRCLTTRPHNLNFSDPGTGKTRSTLDAIKAHLEANGGRTLVLAPKQILIPAWVNDCQRFTPEVSIAAAFAPDAKRRAAFKSADVVVTNHDAAVWLLENKPLLRDFDTLIIDESTAYKNPSAQRTKILMHLAEHFERRTAMTGTPRPNGLLDLWSQAYIVDRGQRLGARYYAFRAATHEPIATPFGRTEWMEKDGANEAVADLLADITIRYTLEECVDMPERHITTQTIELTDKLAKHYREMANHALLEFEQGDVSAVNAAVLANKLLQIASGAVYGIDKQRHLLDTTRYELIAELCQQRETTIVVFQWKHQRDQLIAALERAGINEYTVIDGEHDAERNNTVEHFQAGRYRVLLMQPQKGLTLTRAKTLIWASPTWDCDANEQTNRRIYRIGQTKRTEIIYILAAGTVDELAYKRLTKKTQRQIDLLSLIETLRPRAVA